MYQALVLGLGVLLIAGLGYFIKNTDQTGVINTTISTTQNTTSKGGATSTPVEALSLAGTYVCDVDSKCPNPRTLVIYEDGGLRMTTSFDNGVEVLEETGTWIQGEDGSVTLLITGTNNELYVDPLPLSLKQISSSTLVGTETTAPQYRDWKDPIFRKQQKQEE
jgi:hypothetical protein